MQMNRRAFLEGALAAGAVSALPSFAADKPVTKVAVQLYSVRDLMKSKDGFRSALKGVRDIGYAGVEFAGYGGFSAAELKSMLDDLGLGRAGTHVGMEALRPDKINATIDFSRGFGNRYIIVSWMKPSNDCKDLKGFWKKLADDLSVAAETAKKSGCLVGYHNHQHEFRDKVDGVPPFQIVFDNASPLVCMQADVGHMVSAGEDPVAWVKKYGSRARTLHAKEVYGGDSGAIGVLGQPGKAKGVDWPALYKVTDALKFEWYVVECENDPNTFARVKASWQFLHAAGRC